MVVFIVIKLHQALGREKVGFLISVSSKGCEEGSLCFSGSAHVRVQDLKCQKARAGI